MKASFINLVLVCLDSEFCKSISKDLSDRLDMFFADLEQYIEYDLLDSRAVLEKCGIDYFNMRELNSAKAFAKFQNSVLTVSYDLFKQNRNAFLGDNLLVYLKLPLKLVDKKETSNILAYDSHDIYLTSQSDVIIELKSKAKTKALKEIMLKLGEAL